LAQQLGKPGSVAELTLALTAKPEVIIWELNRRGITLTSHRELFQEKLQHLLDLLLEDSDQKLTLTETEYDTFSANPESGLLPGVFVDCLKPVFQSGIIASFFQFVYQFEANPTGNLEFIQRILEILRKAGWNTNQCKQIIERIDDVSRLEDKLNDKYASLRQKLALAQFINWLDGTLQVLDDATQTNKAHALVRPMRYKLSDELEKFGLVFLFDDIKRDRFLVEQEPDDMNQRIDVYLEEQYKLHSNWPLLILSCLESKSLLPVFPQNKQDALPEENDRKQQLEKQFFCSSQKFTIPYFKGTSTQTVSTDSRSSNFVEPGIGPSLAIPRVSLRQGIRGRIGELYVLESCWQNFLSLDKKSKQEILESLQSYYEKHDRYKDYRLELFKSIDQHKQAILVDDDKKSFCKLLDLTGFGLAGFDILVPVSLWPVFTPVTVKGDIYCVEVKSVYTKTEQITAAEIILTTHEYRVARQNQNDTHLLRLIAVPPGIEDSAVADYSAVKFIRDIDLSKLENENMKDIIFDSVRGGHFPLRLSW
ncbi:MAG: hypothetical protein HGB11_13535, partial [Chlorobiales bacterium]|nr:hypothetical protein [Chlorobiales bacterium]